MLSNFTMLWGKGCDINGDGTTSDKYPASTASSTYLAQMAYTRYQVSPTILATAAEMAVTTAEFQRLLGQFKLAS